MKLKTAVGLFISLISVLGINFIPLEMFLYHDFSSESAMVFYALENIVAIIFAIIFVVLFAPKEEENPDFARREELLKQNPAFPVERIRRKSQILQGYLIFSLAFSAGSLIFLTAFIFIVLKTQIQFASVFTGLLWIVGFQWVAFLANILMLRPVTLVKTEGFLKQSMGRVALLFLAVFAGIFFALFVDKWFVVPFIALKTMVDIVEVFQILKSRENS